MSTLRRRALAGPLILALAACAAAVEATTPAPAITSPAPLRHGWGPWLDGGAAPDGKVRT